MSENIIVEPIIHNIEIIKQANEVTVSYPGPQGEKGSSILNGAGLPSSSLGRNGDYYLDSVSNILYGPKVSDIWPSSGILIKGSTGAQGPKGDRGYSLYLGTSAPSNSLGLDGDVYVRSSDNLVYSKANGVWQTPETLISKSNWSYTYEQQSNQYVWIINHNLGYNPSVDIIDNGGNSIEGDISYTDTNNLTITFTSLVSGFAYLT
jgi:hypothetical protein